MAEVLGSGLQASGALFWVRSVLIWCIQLMAVPCARRLMTRCWRGRRSRCALVGILALRGECCRASRQALPVKLPGRSALALRFVDWRGHLTCHHLIKFQFARHK